MTTQASHLQALVDGMSAQWQAERAGTQMTLGALIAALRQLPPDAPVTGLGELASYRGYYSDLAFEPADIRPVSEVLADCEAAMGEVFEGYKGGEFQMGAKTPLWVSGWGTSSGLRLMRLEVNGGSVVAVTEAEE